MLILDTLAEERTLKALDAGEFDDLPGMGKPLELDDDRLVPEALRMAFRVLKDAGFVPPEVEIRREIGELQRCILDLEDDTERRCAIARLNLFRAKAYARRGGHCGNLRVEAFYLDKLIERLAAGWR